MNSQIKPRKLILAIDPGTTESGWCLIKTPSMIPVVFGLEDNGIIFQRIDEAAGTASKEGIPLEVAIEGFQCYGSPIGQSTITSIFISGKFAMYAECRMADTFLIYRSEEKTAICHTQKCNDAVIKRQLADTFAPGTENFGKGTKKKPGFFYGFGNDVWSAFAIACTHAHKRGYIDLDALYERACQNAGSNDKKSSFEAGKQRDEL